MSLSTRSSLILVAIAIAAATLGWMPPVHAGDDQPHITYSEMRTIGRPEGFYKLEFIASDRVCGSALRLLNRPAAMPRGLRMPYDYAKIDTAFFLGTAANTTWEPKWLITPQSSKGRAGVLSVTTADIFNDGKPLQLLRFELSVGGSLRHVLYAVPQKALQEYLVESGQSVQGLHVVTIATALDILAPYRLDVDLWPTSDPLGEDDYPWEGVFADLIDIDGMSYLVVTSAVEGYRRNRVYVLEFTSRQERSLVCRYGSDYLFAGK